MSAPYGDYDIVIGVEPDIDATDERLWELYLLDCEQKSVPASIKDYMIWLDEKYE